MPTHIENIQKFKQMIASGKRLAIFTGAGISTESGIPDFRSPGGIWTKYKPIDFRDFMASEKMRRESWRRKFASDAVMKQAKPNMGHIAVTKLVEMGKVIAVITQNIDGLHQQSGVPEEKVIELHGNGTYAACLDCGKRFEFGPIREAFEKDETLPICDVCEGIIKTATISFGQTMPIDQMQAAEEATYACDLFIVLGSSLVVYPAADFPRRAKQNGAGLVILNRDATPLDPIADLVLNYEIGPTMSEVL